VDASPSGSQYVVLCDVGKQVGPADSITVVLIFRDAGRVNVQLTVRTPQSAVPRGSASSRSGAGE
jgi:copper(I)-binding protein